MARLVAWPVPGAGLDDDITRHLGVFFFFSSRRRHTRLQGDWSSDVCSSDLRSPVTSATAFLRFGLSFTPVQNVAHERPSTEARSTSAFSSEPARKFPETRAIGSFPLLTTRSLLH